MKIVIVDAGRLAAVISPLRRSLLAAARAAEHLPDIPDSQIEIIRALPRGTVTTSGALAAQLGLSPSTVSNLLSPMEAAGLIVRRPAAADQRKIEVRATDRTLDIFERFDRASAAITQDAASALSIDEQRTLSDALPVLERLREILADRTRIPSPLEAE